MKTIAALSLVLVAAACNRTESQVSTTETTSAKDGGFPAMNAPERSPGAMSPEDRDFMTKAAKGGMLEIALGNEEAQKGANADAKAMGGKIAQDHTAADNELKQIAQTKHLDLPTELDSDQKSTIDKLSKLSGAKLDKEYAKDMVDDHEDDVKAFEKAAKDVQDPELRAWAAKTLPVLQNHLAMAKDLKAKTK